MTTGPWAQDILTRIINVHWGGAIVVGTRDGRIYYGSGAPSTDGTPAFKPVDNNLFNYGPGSVVGLSVATIDGKQVLVAIGMKQFDFFGPKSGCQIVASSDGQNWSVVFVDSNVPIPGQPLMFHSTVPVGIVWDGTMFHASSHYREAVETGTDATGNKHYALQDEGEQMYSSPDGFNWSKAGKYGGWQNLDDTDKIPSKLTPFCIDPRNQGGIPDGLQAYEKGSETFAKPTSLNKFYVKEGAVYVPDPPGSTVTFNEPATPDLVLDAGVKCYAVGGTWIAVGDKIATRAGDSFKTIFELPDSDVGTCVISAQ